jgi:hypothetical protein
LTLILSPLGDILEPSQKKLLQPDHAEKLSLVQKHANRLLNMVNKVSVSLTIFFDASTNQLGFSSLCSYSISAPLKVEE